MFSASIVNVNVDFYSQRSLFFSSLFFSFFLLVTWMTCYSLALPVPGSHRLSDTWSLCRVRSLKCLGAEDFAVVQSTKLQVF